MIKDSNLERVFSVVPDGDSTDVSRNITVVATVYARIPFVSMSQTDGIGENEVENTTAEATDYNRSIASVVYPVPAPGELHNAPFDEDFPDRFTLVGYVADVTQYSDSYLFHDAKHKDLILLPSLDSLGAGDDIDICKNMVIRLNIHAVGVSMSGELETPFAPPNSKGVNVSSVTPQANTKSHAITTYNGTNNAFDNFGRSIGDNYLESRAVGIQNFMSLGNSNALFGVKVPTYRAITYMVNKVKYIYVGHRDIADVLIALPV